MAEFKMPSLGADMTEGTLFEWHVKLGDTIKRGDIIASVETAKGVIDVEIFEEGVVEALLIEPGTEVPVGQVIAVIRGKGEVETPAVTQIQQPTPQVAAVVAAPPKKPAVPVRNGRRRKISPAARKLAKELGVDLHGVTGSGPGGVITRADVQKQAEQAADVRASPVARRMADELGIDLNQLSGTGPRGAISKTDVEQAAAARQPAPPPKPAPAKPAPKKDFQTSMRQAIAAAMSRSNRDIPHYYLETRIDMSKPLRWLEQENEKRSIKERILPAVLLIKAVAKGLVDVPALNGYWVDEQHQPQEGIHIGFAIALRQGGLVTPAIHHADLKSMDELMTALRDLIMRTRAGRLRGSELTDATVTLTNLGDLGVEKVHGVIYPPQVALVGFGKVIDQPWVENGMLGIRPVVTASLAGDHRATDGRVGAQFLESLNKHLQEPETL